MFPKFQINFFRFFSYGMGRKSLVIFLVVLFVIGSFFATPNSAESVSKKNIVDKIYLAKQNDNVVDNFGFVKTAKAALDETQLEYSVHVGPVTGSTSGNYTYAAFFNPTGSNRSVLIKSIYTRSNATSTGTYVNLSLRRITTSTAGTLIAASDIPEKNASSSAPVLEVRFGGPTVAFAGATESRILGQSMPGAVGQFHSIRNITFSSTSERLVLHPGEGISLYQEAAGTTSQQVYARIEWEEVTSAPSAQNEFLFAFPRVEVAASAGYKYNALYNPSGSGKSAIVKRVWLGAETCDTTAVYTNTLSLRRISTSTAGTLIASSSIPKKNTQGATTTLQMRHTNVTVATSGTTEARIASLTPCGAAGEPHGWMELNFNENDEQLILQQGEGIALFSDAAGDIDQIIRMIVEWQEVDAGSTPASQGEYIWGSPLTANVALAANRTVFDFFNPTGSGKTMVVKRLLIRNNADTGATYVSFRFRRTSTSTGGIIIPAGDLVKKHTGTANSGALVRWCGPACATTVTSTYSGTADSALLQVVGPGAVGQVIGQRELVFGNNEKLILQEGEGIGFYNDATGDVDHYIKILIEWDEEASPPASQGEYLIDIGPVSGNTGTSYNYATFFNPATSTKTAVIKRVGIRIELVAAATNYVPMQLRRITTSTAGTQITAANIPKKHSGTADSFMIIRRTGVTATYQGSASSSKLMNVLLPNAVGSAVAPGISGYRELLFENDAPLVLRPGEGVGLYHDSFAGDADFRVKVLFEWEEVATSSAPGADGEYLLSVGMVDWNSASNYVYSSLFNPVTSTKDFVVKRIGMRANRVSAGIHGYTPAVIRRIASVSGGIGVVSGDVAKKHLGTATTTADVRHTGVIVSFAQATTSRLLSMPMPGSLGQLSNLESEIYFDDEFVLKPGEGIALYQEGLQATTTLSWRFGFDLEWEEINQSGGTVSCSSATTTTVFDVLTTASVSTSTPNITNTLSCSASSLGCTLSVSGLGNGTNAGLASSSAAYVITSHSTVLSAGVEGYGIQATTTAGGSGGTLGITSFYNVLGNTVGGLSTSSLTLASSTVAITNREVVVTHKAAISSGTPTGGGYSDTITYSCVGN